MIMDKFLGGVRKNLESIGFGAAIPGLRDRIFDVIAPRNDPAKATLMEDEKEKRRKMKGARTGMKKGGKVKSASKRGDGCATKGKTRGKFV